MTSDISTSVFQRLYNKSTVHGSSILPSGKKEKRKVSTFVTAKRGGHKHFHRLVTPAAYDFVRHEVYTIHLVSVAR